jgi:hypothetical protein
VSRIKIDVSHLGADVLVDGKPERSKTEANSFFFFITPGHHEFRATLAGHEDAVASIDVHKGETVPISLVLKPIPQPESAPPEPAASAAVTCAPCKSSEPEKPIASVKYARSPWSIGAGIVTLSGAISYLPATGVMVGVERRFGEWFSLRLDARAAWSPQYVTKRPMRGFTYAGLLGACATRTKYFACGMMHVGAIGHSLETEKPAVVWKSRFGFGATAGVEVPFHPSFLARFAAEVVLFSDRTQVLTGSYLFPIEVWSGPPALAGFSLTLVWHPELRVLR